jgi:hypothetical protein
MNAGIKKKTDFEDIVHRSDLCSKQCFGDWVLLVYSGKNPTQEKSFPPVKTSGHQNQRNVGNANRTQQKTFAEVRRFGCSFRNART